MISAIFQTFDHSTFPSVGRCSWPQAFDSGVGVDGKTLFEYICHRIFKLGRDCYSRILLE